MVTKKKALIISLISALIVGFIHFIAHRYVYLITTLPSLQVLYVGIIVVISVFIIAYFGMVSFKKRR